jgi:hypothetical protein
VKYADDIVMLAKKEMMCQCMIDILIANGTCYILSDSKTVIKALDNFHMNS